MEKRAQTGTTIMSEPVSAAIHIQGSTIRCAEIVRGDSAPALQRFGHRSFSFDVTRVLWEGAEPASALERVGTAAGEELEGTEASEIRVVFHPLDVFSFFTPISAELSERDRMHQVIQHAALVTGARSPESLRITPRAVRTIDPGNGEVIEWIHVLAMPKAVKRRLQTLLAPIPVQDHVQMVSSEAAARLTGYTNEKEAAPGEARPVGAYSLAVGQYPSHTEYALTYNRAWHHSHATQEGRTPTNRAYYALGFLNRIDVPLREIGRLFVYGSGVDRDAYGPFEAILDCEPEWLNPFQVLRRFPERPQDGVPEASVPCIGAALEAE